MNHESDIAFWHWVYHHDHGVPDNWLVRHTHRVAKRLGLTD